MSKLSETEKRWIEYLRSTSDPVKAFATAVQIITDHLEGEHNYV